MQSQQQNQNDLSISQMQSQIQFQQLSLSPPESRQGSLQNSPLLNNIQCPQPQIQQQLFQLEQLNNQSKDALQGASYRKLLFSSQAINGGPSNQILHINEDIPDIDSLEAIHKSGSNSIIQLQPQPSSQQIKPITSPNNQAIQMMNGQNINEDIININNNNNHRKSSHQLRSNKRISQTTILQKGTSNNNINAGGGGGGSIFPKQPSIQQFNMNHKSSLQNNTVTNFQFPNNNNNNQNPHYRNSNNNNNPKSTQKEVWKKKVLYIIAFVNSFLFHIKKIIVFRRPDLLNSVQLQAINDHASQQVNDDGTWGGGKESVQQLLEREKSLKRTFGKYVKRYKIIKKMIRKSLCVCCFTRGFQRFCAEFSTGLDRFAQKIPVFDQESTIAVVWQTIIMALTVLYLFYVPLEFCFLLKNDNYSYLVMHVILPLVFVGDVVVQANTSYFEVDHVIKEHREILSNYVRKRLFWDLLTIAAIFQDSLDGFSLIFLIRFYHLQKTIQKIKESLTQWSNDKLAAVYLSFLLFRLIFLCHIASCFWFFLGRELRANFNEGWLVTLQDSNYISQNNGIQSVQTPDIIQRIREEDELLQDQSSFYYFSKYYVSAFLFTIATLAGGYGQSSQGYYYYLYQLKETDAEKIFKICLTLISLFLIPYMIIAVKEIYDKMRKKSQQYNEKLQQFNTYLDSHEVDQSLKRRALKYLENQYKEGLHHVQIMDENLNCLSKFLREEIMTEVNLKILKKIQVLTQYFSEKFLQRLSLKMIERVYGPDEQIMMQNSIESPSLYILKQGEVELFIEIGQGRKQHRIVSLKKLNNPYQYFGELEFFSQGYKTLFSARSNKETCVCKIELSVFLDILKDFPDDREIFCYLRDTMILENDLSKVRHSCFTCQMQANHSALECPFIFYGKIRKTVIDKMNKEINETIKNFKRMKSRKKSKAIKIAKILQEKSLNFVDEYEDLIQEYFGELDEYDSSSSYSSSSDNALKYLGEEADDEIDPMVQSSKKSRTSKSSKGGGNAASNENNFFEEESDALQKKIDMEMTKNLKRVPSLTTISNHYGGKQDQLQAQQQQQQQRRPVSQQIIPENNNTNNNYNGSQFSSENNKQQQQYQFFSERLLPLGNDNNNMGNSNNNNAGNTSSLFNPANNNNNYRRSSKKSNTMQLSSCQADQSVQSSQVQSMVSSVNSQLQDEKDDLGEDDIYQRTHRISDSMKNQSLIQEVINNNNNELNTSDVQPDRMPSISSHNRQNSRNLSNISKMSSKGRSHSNKTPQEVLMQNFANLMDNDLNLNSNEKIEWLIKNQQNMMLNKMRNIKSPNQNMMFDFECEEELNLHNNTIQNFKHYYPANNLQNVIDNYNSKNKKIFTKFKSKSRYSQKKIKSSGKVKATPIQNFQQSQEFHLNQ